MRCKSLLTLLAILFASFALTIPVLADADTGANDTVGPGDILPPPGVQEAPPPAPAPQAPASAPGPAAAPVAQTEPPPAPTPVAGADIQTTEPDAEYFYNQLSPYGGSWINVADYGPCWQPANLTPDWRPYTLGHWVYTDDNGWVWVSDEDFGWCCYHYGRWTQVEGTGWVWVPGHRWGPAWVVWRHGDQYVGWAPLPPGRHGRPIEQLIAEVNPYSYNFIDQRFILDDHIREHLEPVTRNVTFVAVTPNVTRFDVVDGKYINHGIAVADVEHWLGHPVDRFHIAEAQAAQRTEIRGHDLVLYRPHPPEHVIGHDVTVDHDHPFFTPAPVHVQTPAEVDAARRSRDDYYNHMAADMQTRHERELASPPPNVQHDVIVHQQEQEQHFMEDQRKQDEATHAPPQVLRHEEEHR